MNTDSNHNCIDDYSSNDIAKLLGVDEAAYVLSIIAVLLPIQFCNDIFVSRLSKEKKFKEEAKAIACAELCSVIFAITLAYMGFGVWALITQHFLANVIRFLIFFILLNGWVIGFKFSEIKGLMRFSVVSFFIELFNFVSINAPLLILSRTLGVSYSGDYSVKNRVASLPGDVIQQALSRVMFPYIADSSCKDSIHKALHWSTKLNSLFLMPCFVGLAIVSQLATEVLLGKEFMKYWVILCLISISKAIVSPFSGINSYLKGIGKIESLLMLYIFRTVLVISLGIIFVDLFGYVGIGYAVLFTAVFTVFINLSLAKTYSGLTILNLCSPIYKPFLASLTMALITYIAAENIDYFAILDLLICAALGLFIYLVSLLLLIPELRKLKRLNDLKQFLLDTP